MNMHPTRNDIEENSRTVLAGLLNACLADAVDLATQMKQAHWNVKGPGFIALHELFDSIHDEVRVHVDDIAERITAIGGTALGTASEAASHSRLAAYPLDIHSGPEHVNATAAALAMFARTVRQSVAESQEIGDAGTEDLLIGISRDIDKSLWLVEAHEQIAS